MAVLLLFFPVGLTIMVFKLYSWNTRAGIFSSTFLQPVNGSKTSILNWVMKLNYFICSKSLKDFPFYSRIHFSDYFSSGPKCIFKWSGDLNFKNPHRDNELNSNQTVKKLNLWRKTAWIKDKSASIKAWKVMYIWECVPRNCLSYFIVSTTKYILHINRENIPSDILSLSTKNYYDKVQKIKLIRRWGKQSSKLVQQVVKEAADISF